MTSINIDTIEIRKSGITLKGIMTIENEGVTECKAISIPVSQKSATEIKAILSNEVEKYIKRQ
jgi:hypothetical protein